MLTEVPTPAILTEMESSPPKSSLAVCAPVLQLVNLNFTYNEFYNDLDSTCCYNDNILNINKQ